jgi:transposase InsO family protein
MRAITDALKVARSNMINKVHGKQSKRKKYVKEGDRELIELIKPLLKEKPSYGYKRITALLNSKLKSLGLKSVNHKKVYRLMRDHGLLLSKPVHRPKRAHIGKIETIASNMRWCSDHFSIQCWNGDRVHIAFSLDTCDREIMRWIASTIGIDGQQIRNLMLETVEYRFGQAKVPRVVQWLSDNGSCYVSRETVSFGRELGLDIRTTPVRSPESNGMAEAFVKTFKRDYVVFGNLRDGEAVMSQLSKWMEDYNEKAPHKALKMLSPREFIKQKLAS